MLKRFSAGQVREHVARCQMAEAAAEALLRKHIVGELLLWSEGSQDVALLAECCAYLRRRQRASPRRGSAACSKTTPSSRRSSNG